jgi:multicomponent Na+:H+ antiporter subunit C
MTTVNLVMAGTVGVLYGTGVTLLLSRSLMRVLIGVVVLGHGTNLLLQLAGGPPASWRSSPTRCPRRSPSRRS